MKKLIEKITAHSYFNVTKNTACIRSILKIKCIGYWTLLDVKQKINFTWRNTVNNLH